PPRNTVLRADHSSLGPEHRYELRSQLCQPVGFYSQKDDVDPTGILKVCHHLGAGLDLTFRAHHTDAPLLHSAKMRATGEDDSVHTCARYQRADIRADCARSRDQESHSSTSRMASATSRRRTLPVAVVGMLSIM